MNGISGLINRHKEDLLIIQLCTQRKIQTAFTNHKGCLLFDQEPPSSQSYKKCMFIHVYKFMSISHFVRLSQTVYYRQIFELFLFLNSSLKSWAICLYAPLFLPMNSFLFGMDSVSFICKKPFSRFFSFFHISVSSEWCYE